MTLDMKLEKGRGYEMRSSVVAASVFLLSFTVFIYIEAVLLGRPFFITT